MYSASNLKAHWNCSGYVFFKVYPYKNKKNREKQGWHRAGGWEAGLMITRGADPGKWSPSWPCGKPGSNVTSSAELSAALEPGKPSASEDRNEHGRKTAGSQDRLKVSLSNKAFSLLTHSTVMAPAASWRLILQKRGGGCEGDKWTSTHEKLRNPALCFHVFPGCWQLGLGHLDKRLEDRSLGT